MAKFQRLKGFRDFYPEDLAKREYITSTWRRIAKQHGFVEYDAPPLEALDLYRHKSGEELVGQLYSFVDKGGREVAMRPEMTPSVARMVTERWQTLAKPVKWFSIPQLFRYERPQAGRLREHFQFNADIFGDQAPVSAEAELLSILIECFEAFGLSANDVQIRLSDRRVLNSLLAEFGIVEAKFSHVYAVLDKFDRQPRDRSRAILSEHEISRESIDMLFAKIDALRDSRGIPAAFFTSQHAQLYNTYNQLMELKPGAAAWIVVDLAIVRGLGYYTGTVFEAFDARGEYRAICGGGRYDNLLESLGGPPASAVGFGWGDVVLTDLLEARGAFGNAERAVDFLVFGVEQEPENMFGMIGQLRAAGFGAVYATKSQALRALSGSTGLSDAPRFLLNVGRGGPPEFTNVEADERLRLTSGGDFVAALRQARTQADGRRLSAAEMWFVLRSVVTSSTNTSDQER